MMPPLLCRSNGWRREDTEDDSQLQLLELCKLRWGELMAAMATMEAV
jgi:hypothetical protein